MILKLDKTILTKDTPDRVLLVGFQVEEGRDSDDELVEQTSECPQV